MVQTIEAAFREFHSELTPSSAETEAAKSHRESIRKCLHNAFTVNRFFRMGSFGNGTSIRNFSDVDILANLLHSSLPANSITALTNVRDVLANRFPRTGVRVNSPAVYVPFGGDRSEDTEVVPSTYRSKHGEHELFNIANGSGGWTIASPTLHNEYVSNANRRLNNKVKPLVRFIKAWKFYNNVPILSFFLELYVAKYSQNESSIIYHLDVKRIFGELWQNQLSGITDPVGGIGIH